MAVGQGAACFRVHQLAELGQRLGHLVAALAAAHINNNVGVAPLCQLMLGHGFACAKAPGNGGRAALCNGEHGVHHTHAGDQRALGGHALPHRPGPADGPGLAQGQLVLLAPFVPQLHHGVGHGVLPVRGGPDHLARNVRRHHAFVQNDRGFRAGRVDIAGL